MANNIKIFMLAISSFLLTEISAQANIYEIESVIKSELTTKYGEVYSVGVIEDVNEEIHNYRDFKFPITDPYNTLRDSYIFPAYVTDGGLIGIYKNGSIIWDSGPIIEPGVNEVIFGTMDLNNDGYVEIISSFYYGIHNSSQSIWIYSWDGQNGSLLNEIRSYGSLNKSVIFSYDWFTDFYDVEGDGILEVKGQDEETREAKIYSWNGSKYGDFGVPVPEYVPMNLLTTQVNCKVERSQYGFLYNYTIKNDSTSKQPIWRFVVEKPYEYVYAGSDTPNEKWNDYYSDNWDLYLWEVNTDLQKYPFDYLSPGEEKSDYKLETETPLIYIGNYYIQGKNGEEPYNDLYILVNSVKGKTLYGKYPPDPFIPLNFLDILINYTDSSYSLGWITNQPTTDKYDSLFITAKTQLQQNNNNAARTTLQTVLQEVDVDSTNNLTSEAYALLRYNTEYLINQIPEGL